MFVIVYQLCCPKKRRLRMKQRLSPQDHQRVK